ncbi:MAG: DNA polymerase III, alpha subunit [Caudoviricetes sp.]|nr:MAG: DNA polymerase III, alpha subunit [Caudoviricetes sp.]
MEDRTDIHNHSRGSNMRLRDALPTPQQLIDRAIEIGLKGIALTDHDFIGMHVKANKYAQEIKEKYPDFKVILGNEIYLIDERPCDIHYHFILLAKDKIGHRQLRRLSSIAWLNSYNAKGMDRVDTLKSDLEMIIKEDSGHLIVSSACIGSQTGQSILAISEAETLQNIEASDKIFRELVSFLKWCKELFGEDFYLECQPGISKEQILVNKKTRELSNMLGIKMVPTSDSHYLKKEDRYVHKAFLNSENKEREVDAFYQDAYLHTNEEMFEKFSLSEFEKDFVKKMFENSMEIYNKIEDYSLLHTPVIPKVDVDYFPKIDPSKILHPSYKTLCNMYKSDDEVRRYWVNTCINKLKEIGKFSTEYLDELEEEAEVKEIVSQRLNNNMFQYPVTLAHYVDMIWECGSAIGCGRGSACSALNHYLMNITQLDPLEWNFPFFRYMNRDTDAPGDIDIDVCSSKAQFIVNSISKERSKKFIDELSDIEKENLGAVYVCTYGTETSKSAVLTAARGYRSIDYPDGIDNDTAQYMSSLIKVERGFVWSISDTYYGNPDKERKPVKLFVNEVDQYPGLLDIMLGIEGNISRRGRHASGVLLMGEDPYEFNAFMKTPSGEVVTQYDLHDAEDAGSIKIDLLVTEVMDKLVQTLNFLKQEGLIKGETLREMYNNCVHPDVLPLKDKDTWNNIKKVGVLDLFQFDTDVGRQGIKKIQPDNIIELSSVNGLIRLMNQNKNAETWLDKYHRYKYEPSAQKREMDGYGLSPDEQDALMEHLKDTLSIGISQEQFMRVLMDERLCGFSLSEANKARKVVSKKKMTEIPALKKKIFEKAVNEYVANYVWDYVAGPGMGYSFSEIHSLSYAFIGFQTAYLATRWNPIYWNTSCLIVNSGSLEDEGLEDKDKKKEKSSDYAKIAKALGEILSRNIKVSLVDINKSDFTFKPDIENNQILFGMKALSKVNKDTIEKIISNRPYVSFKDFLNRCKLNKSIMFSLIKSGAFDNLESEWAKELGIEPRILIMVYFISIVCEPKKKLNLSNFNSIVQKDLLWDDERLVKGKNVYFFNKHLKTKKSHEFYILDDVSYSFYQKHFDLNELDILNNVIRINQKTWDKIYQKEMDVIRAWLQTNQENILSQFNQLLFLENWNKYAAGTISTWEMESLCFYYHEHELANVDNFKYGIIDFNNLSEEPVIDRYYKRNNQQIPIYKLSRIVGTVISKNDSKSSISLLTTSGVVNVKFTKEYYAMYKRQISKVQPDGTKKVIEKSWFQRGTKVMVSGYRKDDTFICKSYANSSSHQLYKITKVSDDGEINLIHERALVDG